MDLRNTNVNELDQKLMIPLRENFKFASRNNIYLKIELQVERVIDISLNHLIKNKVKSTIS